MPSKIRRATLEDVDPIEAIDKVWYHDAFLYTKNEFRDMVNGTRPTHNLFVRASPANEVEAYLIYMVMPNATRDVYIVSLAGKANARTALAGFLVRKFARKNASRRFYTHGKRAWGMAELEAAGFKRKGKGNMADEVVPFVDDISKLHVWEHVSAPKN